VTLGGYRKGAARQSSTRREQETAEADPLRDVLALMVAAGMSYRVMVQTFAGIKATPASP
jgi:hypothetical protein